MMQKNGGFAHLILVSIVALVVLLSILTFTVFDKSEKTGDVSKPVASPTITYTQPEPTVSDVWNIPNLSSGFDWQTKSLGKDEAANYRMYWDSMGSDNSYGNIAFDTTLYFTDLNYDDPKDILDYYDFINKFIEEMVNKGWNYDAYYGNKRIMGMSADGVFASVYGTVKISGNQIRSVGYSYNLSSTSWEGPGSGVVCPCRLHLEIFVGDEVNLQEVL